MRLPNWIDDIGWEQGIEQSTFLQLLDYWRDGFDWRAQEHRLNRSTTASPRSTDNPSTSCTPDRRAPDAVPLVLVHGWPGSFHEFMDAIPLLTDPPDGGPGFHVVAPDVPGFGWSAPTCERGWNSRRTAVALGELMTRLGYERFGLQGGDVGAAVTQNMADLFQERAVGLHLNFCYIEPYEGAPTPTEDEQKEMARLARSRQTSMGYLIEQSTKPQTLGIGLQDSPAGHLAWIAEKLQAWSDSGGDLFRALHSRPGADVGDALLGLGLPDFVVAHLLGESSGRGRWRASRAHRGPDRCDRLPWRAARDRHVRGSRIATTSCTSRRSRAAATSRPSSSPSCSPPTSRGSSATSADRWDLGGGRWGRRWADGVSGIRGRGRRDARPTRSGLRCVPTRDRSELGRNTMRQVLSDVRVVEIGGGVAAGWCGKAYADLGADVVKVEPPEGDPLRSDRGMFTHLHTNKRSAVVETAPAAAPALRALLDGVDLVIDTPGIRSLADWGIDRDDVLAAAAHDIGARDHRVRRDRPLRRLRVERPRGPGVQWDRGARPARSGEAADVAR